MQERDIKKLTDALKKTKQGTNVSKETVTAATENLSQAQKEKMNALLNDPEQLKKLMDSPIAKKLLSELQGK